MLKLSKINEEIIKRELVLADLKLKTGLSLESIKAKSFLEGMKYAKKLYSSTSK